MPLLEKFLGYWFNSHKTKNIMQPLNCKTAHKAQRPERIIQFGEGNFLRAFIDWIVWQMDNRTAFNSSVVIVQPIAQGMADRLQAQDCLTM